MFFKTDDMTFDFDIQYRTQVTDLINWLLEDGPQGFYILTNNGETIKKSTIKGTGVNSFAPVVRINISEIYEKIIIRFDFSAFKATEIGFLIFMAFSFLFIFICLFTHAFEGVFFVAGLIIILFIYFYGFYNYFLNKCINKIRKEFNTIKQNQSEDSSSIDN